MQFANLAEVVTVNGKGDCQRPPGLGIHEAPVGFAARYQPAVGCAEELVAAQGTRLARMGHPGLRFERFPYEGR